MATSTQLRAWWSAYRCTTSQMVRVPFPGDGRVWNLLVAKEAAPTLRAFAEVMVSTGYLFRESAGGTYNCRKIAGTDSWSLHSYGIAVDLNPSKNPYGKPLRHDFPPEFLAGVDSIVTSTGTRAFKWGGLWNTPDAMHFEIDVSPSALAGGVTWNKPSEEDHMITKWLTEAGFRELYKLGVVGGASEQAVIDHWITNRAARQDAEHARSSSDIFVALARKAAAGGSGTDAQAREAAGAALQALQRVKSVI